MAWDFETEKEYQVLLDWAEEFVRTKVAPLDMVLGSAMEYQDPDFIRCVRPLQQEVKEMGLWACHLGPELGGLGFGQLKLALLNEILGQSRFASVVFGCQAPDTGNAEILAHYGTDEIKERYLQPLLNGELASSYSMTEPQGGADPTQFKCMAVEDGDDFVINGEKWFSSNARYASFLIVMAVTDPEASAHGRASMLVVPTDTPGVDIVRNVGVGAEPPGHGSHAYVRYTDVRIPKSNILGPRGQGFAVAQTRLGGGRIHHAMRTVGQIRRAFDMMCERTLSRNTKGEVLASKQMVQEKIADSWIEMESFRLLVLRTAWRIDQYNDYMKVRKDIAAIKAAMPKVYHDVVSRCIQVHGALGISNELPLSGMLLGSYVMGIADGPTEVHKVTLARQVLRDYEGTDELFPKYTLPNLRSAALDQVGHLIEREVEAW
ncbi:MAG: acyl-CoA dehydrogenase [Gammaproteobacteria bacterium]|jgi:acyl-CoA dehydrogenase|nr:acyl-CoA dehydrogenase [Gammaproteobacteria bacterium]MBT5203509.1 acyl-CoA dehydrogenase [Gammaproteobacteria bacterium]MBT5600971.1 acyl-CoA dehydrogenase [Gammaproteobacteria bacterium]